MKHLKTYESYKEPEPGDPIVGDWVLIKSSGNRKVSDYMDNNPALIISDESSDMAVFRTYKVEYPDAPTYIDNRLNNIEGNLIVWDSEILYHSKNREDVELFIQSNKYNL